MVALHEHRDIFVQETPVLAMCKTLPASRIDITAGIPYLSGNQKYFPRKETFGALLTRSST